MADEEQVLVGTDRSVGAIDNGDLSLATAAGSDVQPAEAAGEGASAEAVVAAPEVPIIAAPAWRAALDSMSEGELAELESHPQVRGLVRRREEAARQSIAAQQQRANEVRLAALADVDDYTDRSMQWYQKAIDDGMDPLQARRIHKASLQEFALGIGIRAVNDHLEALHQILPPDAMVSEATLKEYQEVRQKATGRNGAGPLDLLRVTMKMVNEATVFQVRQKAETEGYNAGLKRAADERKTAQLKANEERRKNGNGPTNMTGTTPSGSGINSLADAARRYNLPDSDPNRITHEQYGQFRKQFA